MTERFEKWLNERESGSIKQYVEELEKQIEQMQDAKCISCTDLGGMLLKITDLEKENAKLKRNKKTVVHLADCLEEKMKERIEELETRCTELFFQCNKQNEQLTQAEEIIKGLLSCCRNYPQENAEKVEQAKQFLREIDIDNAIQKANEGLDLDKIADEVEEDLKDSCPDILCEDCTKEDCTVRKLGLVPNKEIENER